MKKVYLVHCWSGTTKDGWYPWLKKELSSRNVEVIMEDMPNTDEPTINGWVSKLNDLVESLDENIYFVGHSIGCQTIMRYLETKKSSKIGGILFVAPWFDLLPYALEDGADLIADEWIKTPIDFEKVRESAKNITAIFSDNDYFVDASNQDIFRKELCAKIVVLSDKGHISQDDEVFEEKTILDEILILLEG